MTGKALYAAQCNAKLVTAISSYGVDGLERLASKIPEDQWEISEVYEAYAVSEITDWWEKYDPKKMMEKA